MSERDPFIGRVIGGRYELRERVGAGGWGTVYRALHTRLDHCVAIKVLAGNLSAHPSFVARFEREAKTTCRLDHPNIVNVFDFGDEPGVGLFLAMDFLDGETLRERLARTGPFSLEQVLRVSDQLAAALAHAHGQGVIHRDLKPGNVMLVAAQGDSDHVKLMDFGIARLQEGSGEESVITASGIVLGTPAYMSPEQLSGASDVGPRADMFTMGALLYELISGTRPFQAQTSMSLAMEFANGLTPVPPSARRPDLDIPSAFNAIVLRCLEPNPAERFVSMDALRGVLAEVGHLPRAPTTPSRLEAMRAEPEPEPERFPALSSDSAPMGTGQRLDEPDLRDGRRREAPALEVDLRPTKHQRNGSWGLPSPGRAARTTADARRWLPAVLVVLALVALGAVGVALLTGEPSAGEPSGAADVAPASEDDVGEGPAARSGAASPGESTAGDSSRWVRVEPGNFRMGSPPTEEGRSSNERQHVVSISHPFLLRATEVTQGEWQRLMGNAPAAFAACGPDCPVEKVNWWEALAYCNALSRSEGRETCYVLAGCSSERPGQGMVCRTVEFRGLGCQGYRLPTEAEWEYAARAGTEETRYGPLPAIAWYGGNSHGTTHPVGTREPNAWGLHDMLGNVWEWCWDRYTKSSANDLIDPTGPASGGSRVYRGGAWHLPARFVRAAYRVRNTPDKRFHDLGLRPARSLTLDVAP